MQVQIKQGKIQKKQLNYGNNAGAMKKLLKIEKNARKTLWQ